MGISERRERERQEKKDLILRTALRLFVEEGFDNVTIRKIAKEIDFSQGKIYLYFKNKNEIFREIHNLAFTEFHKRQLSVQHIENPLEKLIEHGKAYIGFALENPELYDVMFIMKGPVRKLLKPGDWEQGMKTYDLLKSNIKECMEAGGFKGLPLDLLAFSLWAYVHGISAIYVKGRMPEISREQLNDLVNNAMNFIRRTY